MIAYGLYRTPVQYNKHYLCNVSNTPSSDSYDPSLMFVLLHPRVRQKASESVARNLKCVVDSLPSFHPVFVDFDFFCLAEAEIFLFRLPKTVGGEK